MLDARLPAFFLKALTMFPHWSIHPPSTTRLTDMKLGVVIVEIVYIGDFMFLFLRLKLVCTLWDIHYIVYVTVSRFIVPYSL